jgi:GGDEF domain-containing protein
VVDLQKKIAFWSDGRERNHREPSPRGGRPALCGTNSFTMRSQQPMRSPVARNVRSGLRSRARNSAGSRAICITNEARIPVHIWAVPARDEHGIVVGGQQSFEDRHRHEKAEPREEGAKDSGYTDEITGIDSRTIMRSHLLETLRSCRYLSAFLHLRLKGFEVFRVNSGAEAVTCMLRMVAPVLELAVWRTDHVGRWADDQVLVILNGSSGHSLRAVGDPIGRMLASDG